MRTLTLAETKAHLSAVVDQVIDGEEVVITRRGRPVVRIVAEREAPTGDVPKLLEELHAFLLSQPPCACDGSSVEAMRAEEPY